MTTACDNNLNLNWQNLPVDILRTVFRFSPIEYLFACASVCNQWKTVIYEADIWLDLSIIKHDVAVIDAAFWTSNPIMSPHFKEGVTGAPPLNKLKFYQTYAKVVQLLKKEKWEIEHDGPRFTLMLVPKNYSHAKLKKLQDDEEWPFSFDDETTDNTLNTDREAYWIFLPNGILVGSRKTRDARDLAIATIEKIKGSRFPQQAEIGILVFASDAARIFEALNGENLDDVATGLYSFFMDYGKLTFAKPVKEKTAIIGEEANVASKSTVTKITIPIDEDGQKEILIRWLPYSSFFQFCVNDDDMYLFCQDEAATLDSSKVIGFSYGDALTLHTKMVHEQCAAEYGTLLVNDSVYGISFVYDI